MNRTNKTMSTHYVGASSVLISVTVLNLELSLLGSKLVDRRLRPTIPHRESIESSEQFIILASAQLFYRVGMFFSLVNINSYFRLSKVILTLPDYFYVFKVAYAGDYEELQ